MSDRDPDDRDDDREDDPLTLDLGSLDDLTAEDLTRAIMRARRGRAGYCPVAGRLGLAGIDAAAAAPDIPAGKRDPSA